MGVDAQTRATALDLLRGKAVRRAATRIRNVRLVRDTAPASRSACRTTGTVQKQARAYPSNKAPAMLVPIEVQDVPTHMAHAAHVAHPAAEQAAALPADVSRAVRWAGRKLVKHGPGTAAWKQLLYCVRNCTHGGVLYCTVQNFMSHYSHCSLSFHC